MLEAEHVRESGQSRVYNTPRLYKLDVERTINRLVATRWTKTDKLDGIMTDGGEEECTQCLLLEVGGPRD